MEFIVYLAYMIVIMLAAGAGTILVCAAIGNAMAKNRKKQKSQAVLNKSGRNDIRVDK